MALATLSLRLAHRIVHLPSHLPARLTTGREVKGKGLSIPARDVRSVRNLFSQSPFAKIGLGPTLSAVCVPSSSSALFATKGEAEPVPEMESVTNNEGLVSQPDAATSSYIMQQTMYRIKDPTPSLHFYSKVLGMRLLKRLDFPEAKFTLYFMGYENEEEIPEDTTERVKWTFGRKATIELTHNWGTESDPDFKGYHNGNSDPRGWGHIGIKVDDVYKACERFESLGVEFVKRPDEGRMKGLAFIRDPDGYWIEIFDTDHMAKLLS